MRAKIYSSKLSDKLIVNTKKNQAWVEIGEGDNFVRIAIANFPDSSLDITVWAQKKNPIKVEALLGDSVSPERRKGEV